MPRVPPLSIPAPSRYRPWFWTREKNSLRVYTRSCATGQPRDRFSLQRILVTGKAGALTVEATLQPLNPREIQTRVRSGDSPEVIAESYGWPLDRVLRYAEPLLAERAYIAGLAKSVEIRRSRGGATLEESALSVIKTDDPSALVWDAYREADGKWIVTAVMGSSLATWTYDVTGKSVHPQDAGARKLMGVDAEPIDSLDLIADKPVPASDTVTIEHPVHGERPRLVAVPEPEAEPDLSQQADHHAEADAYAPVNDVTLDLEIPHTATPAVATKKAKSKRGRASIPSWDEILFGATKAPKED